MPKNKWTDALDRAAQSIEKPTEDDLDETLREQYGLDDER